MRTEETVVFDSIIDPTVGPAAALERDRPTLAARPGSLSGLRLGLLANTKRNAEQFLADVGRELAEQYGMVQVLAVKKPNIVETAPAEMMAELTEQCDIVVAGVGDCGSCSASTPASNKAMSCSCGEVNGWCAAIHVFSLSSHSNMGKFVTHKKRKSPR